MYEIEEQSRTRSWIEHNQCPLFRTSILIMRNRLGMRPKSMSHSARRYVGQNESQRRRNCNRGKCTNMLAKKRETYLLWCTDVRVVYSTAINYNGYTMRESSALLRLVFSILGVNSDGKAMDLHPMPRKRKFRYHVFSTDRTRWGITQHAQ